MLKHNNAGTNVSCNYKFGKELSGPSTCKYLDP